MCNYGFEIAEIKTDFNLIEILIIENSSKKYRKEYSKKFYRNEYSKKKIEFLCCTSTPKLYTSNHLSLYVGKIQFMLFLLFFW